MLGFQALSIAPISVLAPPFISQPNNPQLEGPVAPVYGGDDAWLSAKEAAKNAKDLTAEYAKDKADRAKRLIQAWEDKYEPKPVEAAPVAVQEITAPIEVIEADPEQVITSLEPFVFPAINISDEEIQAVMELAIQARQAAWMQRMNLIKMRLAKASEEQNAHLLSTVQQPRLH